MKAKRNSKTVAARSHAAPPIPAEPLVEVVPTPEIMEAARAYYTAWNSIDGCDFGKCSILRLEFMTPRGCAKAKEILSLIEATPSSTFSHSLSNVYCVSQIQLPAIRTWVCEHLDSESVAANRAGLARKTTQLIKLLEGLGKRTSRLQRSTKGHKEGIESNVRTFRALKGDIWTWLQLIGQCMESNPTFPVSSSPYKLVHHLLWSIDSHHNWIINAIPTHVFLGGPIDDLCMRLGTSNALLKLPLVSADRQVIKLLTQLYDECHLCLWEIEVVGERFPNLSESQMAELRTLQGKLEKCFEQMRRFVHLLFQALPAPGSTEVKAPTKPNSDKSLLPSASTALPEAEASRPPPAKESSLDSQGAVVEIEQPRRSGNLQTGDQGPDEIVVYARRPTDQERQRCDGADRYSLLALFCLVGKSGSGEMERKQFVRLCFQTSETEKNCKPAELSRLISHSVQNRLWGPSMQAKIGDVRDKAPKEKARPGWVKIAGLQFKTSLTPDEVRTHLEKDENRPVLGKGR